MGIKEGEGGNRILGVWGGCEGRKKTTRGGYLRGETDERGNRGEKDGRRREKLLGEFWIVGFDCLSRKNGVLHYFYPQ